MPLKKILDKLVDTKPLVKKLSGVFSEALPSANALVPIEQASPLNDLASPSRRQLFTNLFREAPPSADALVPIPPSANALVPIPPSANASAPVEQTSPLNDLLQDQLSKLAAPSRRGVLQQLGAQLATKVAGIDPVGALTRLALEPEVVTPIENTAAKLMTPLKLTNTDRAMTDGILWTIFEGGNKEIRAFWKNIAPKLKDRLTPEEFTELSSLPKKGFDFEDALKSSIRKTEIFPEELMGAMDGVWEGSSGLQSDVDFFREIIDEYGIDYDKASNPAQMKSTFKRMFGEDLPDKPKRVKRNPNQNAIDDAAMEAEILQGIIKDLGKKWVANRLGESFLSSTPKQQAAQLKLKSNRGFFDEAIAQMADKEDAAALAKAKRKWTPEFAAQYEASADKEEFLERAFDEAQDLLAKAKTVKSKSKK